MGNCEADWLLTSGAFACEGSCMPSSAAWRSDSASSVSASRSNSTTTTENPCEEVDRIDSIPCTPSIASSTGCVTCSSTRWGPAPAMGVEMVMIGKEMSGKSSWLRLVVRHPAYGVVERATSVPHNASGYLVHACHVINENDPPVLRIVVAVYHPMLGQLVHKLRRSRRRDPQLLGELPDGARPTRQRYQDLNVPRRNLNARRHPAT